MPTFDIDPLRCFLTYILERVSLSRQDHKWSTCVIHPCMPSHDSSEDYLHMNLVVHTSALNIQLLSIRYPLHASTLRSPSNPLTPSGRKQISWCDNRFLAKDPLARWQSRLRPAAGSRFPNWRERLSAAAGCKRICQRACGFQAGNLLPRHEICFRPLGVSGFALFLNAMA